jgi:methyl-accepting chemotaxis protein
MSRPTTTTLAPHRARLVRAWDQATGTTTLRLLDRALAALRELANRLRVLSAELADTRRSLHHRFDHLETVMTDVRSEFNQTLTDLGSAISELSTRIAALPDDANDITQADLDAIKSLTGQVNTLAVAAPEVPTEETPAPVEGEPVPAPVEEDGTPVEESPAINDETPNERTVSLDDSRP